jgi:glycosyltransferase involved in cell wall biosynthesis
MIRVLQFADIINRYDFIDNIVRGVDRRRFAVGICVRSPAHNIEAPVFDASVPFWTLNGVSRRQGLRAAFQLAGILRRWKTDILHTHHYDQALIGWIASRLYPKARLVIGRHYSDSIYRGTSGPKRRLLLALEQVANRAAARIVVPSTMIREILVQRQGIDPSKVDLVTYGFAPEKYELPDPEAIHRVRRELGLEGRFVLGNFARLHEEKGHRYLLQAMADLRPKLPQLTLLISGDGPERKALERQINDLDLGGVVRLLGWRRDAMRLMAAVDAVVQPTLQEAFSQVMVEALWMGKPLIITDVGGATDIICDSTNGLLVPKGDAPALAGAIDRVVGSAPLRERLITNGKRYVQARLTVSEMSSKFERIYDSLMA